jgi:starch phosphorylase
MPATNSGINSMPIYGKSPITRGSSCKRHRATRLRVESDIRDIPDETLWNFRSTARKALVEYSRKRLSRQLAASGAPSEAVERARHLFDPNALTLGFARRFATYKRPNLLLQDPARLLRLLNDEDRPVQLIIAGKAHPEDGGGQELIHQWMEFIRQPDNRSHVIFLSDYDMLLTESLVQGVDVWINTPRRPWEACGTSGMKVLVNGGINLSELDGWWAEAYTPDVGWAVGDGQEHGDDPAWDANDARSLYELLENKVVPEFYSRDKSGIPVAWIKRIRESMARLTPRFSADRAVRQYTEQRYLPAAAGYVSRQRNKGEMGKSIVDWRRRLNQNWAKLRFGNVKIETGKDRHLFEVQLYSEDVDPAEIRVEIYADGLKGGPPLRQEMRRTGGLSSPQRGYVYTAEVPASRPCEDYSARVIPVLSGIAVPLESTEVLWQR